ncbi:N/A [soil metagenome]
MLDEHRPDVIFHLAALPIVRTSYAEPVVTFETNVMGTVALLDAVRRAGRPCRVVVITSDKCYRDQHVHWGYREDDPLGGSDPYSASKGAQELVTAAYRKSYFGAAGPLDGGVRLGSARAGNVIGGGDWADQRIVPDAMRALAAGDELVVRNPEATRPWQHVLSPLSGYLLLGASLDGPDGHDVADSWNFGPSGGAWPVRRLVETALDEWGGGAWRAEPAADGLAEAGLLSLSIDRARSLLGWEPVWDTETSIRRTVRWYRRVHDARADPAEAVAGCTDDLEAFENAATDQSLDWFT